MNREQAGALLKKAGRALKKYRYACLVLLLGAALLMWPQRETPAAEEEQSASEQAGAEAPETTEARLEALLSQVEGAGSVRVMLTLRSGAETIYQTDRKTSGGGTGTASEETTTVLANQGSAGQTPVAVRTDCPVYLGAVVICEGAEKSLVRLRIVEAVASLTGLGSDHITVLKMKAQ